MPHKSLKIEQNVHVPGIQFFNSTLRLCAFSSYFICQLNTSNYYIFFAAQQEIINNQNKLPINCLNSNKEGGGVACGKHTEKVAHFFLVGCNLRLKSVEYFKTWLVPNCFGPCDWPITCIPNYMHWFLFFFLAASGFDYCMLFGLIDNCLLYMHKFEFLITLRCIL